MQIIFCGSYELHTCVFSMYVKCMLLHIIMHTLHAWFTVVVYYLCTACDAIPGGNNGGGNNGGGSGATPVYTVVTLLSAMFFAGMAMIFN